MGLLDKLWDDTVAGPRPETGLGRLRRHHTFSYSASALRSTAEDVPVTRSITIVRSPSSPRSVSTDTGSIPSSPAGLPDSPRTPTPRGDWKRLRRNWGPDASDPAEPRSPTVYDWVVISAIDR